jgi:uncharacterized HAD superfamily protein
MTLEQYAEDLKKKLGCKCLVIAVDLDGVLCEGEYWGLKDDEPEPKPKLDMIRQINKLHRSNNIVIHTARRRYLAERTMDWLDKYGVKYHSLRFDKLPTDIYVDDKAWNPTLDK